MGPLDFSPDRSSSETFLDRQLGAREALVSETLPDRHVLSGDNSRTEQFERAAAFSNVTGAWSRVFGSQADISAAIVRLSLPARVDPAGDNTSRLAAPAVLPPPETPRPPQVEIPSWAVTASRSGQGDGPYAPPPPNWSGADTRPQPGYNPGGDAPTRTQPGYTQGADMPSRPQPNRQQGGLPYRPRMDVPQQLEVRDAGDRGVAPSGGQGYAGLRSAIERARQGGGPVRILHYGASHTVAGIEANTFESLLEQQAPVDYTRQAKNGISASYPLSRKQEWLDEPIQRTRPDLVVVEFGNNDGAAPINKARYARQFEELILSIKQRAPNASIMIMGPTDGCSIQGANKGNLLPGLTDVIAVQKEIAAKYSIDYFDIRQAMGGAGSVYEWRQRGLVSSDLLHFTKSGYEELGRMRYDHLRSRISS